MYYVFSRIYYVSRGPHGRMAILAKCVTLLKVGSCPDDDNYVHFYFLYFSV